MLGEKVTERDMISPLLKKEDKQEYWYQEGDEISASDFEPPFSERKKDNCFDIFVKYYLCCCFRYL